MVWSGKGQHEGEDVNDIPDRYFTYMAANSQNPNSVKVAQQVMAYRQNSGYTVADLPRGQQGSKPAASNQAPSAPSNNSAGLRAKVLTLAVEMDSKNPWPYLKPIKDYIETGQLPNLASMLTDEPQKQDQKNEQFDLASDENPPF